MFVLEFAAIMHYETPKSCISVFFQGQDSRESPRWLAIPGVLNALDLRRRNRTATASFLDYTIGSYLRNHVL